MSFHNCRIVKANCTYAEYHKQKDGVKRGDREYSMSRSELVEFALCPARWKDAPIEEESTAATDWGNLIECLTTNPKSFDDLFAVTPETYTNKKGQKIAWKNDKRIDEVAQFLDANKGKIIIKNDTLVEARKAVESVFNFIPLLELLNVSRKQVFVSGIWKDKSTGIEIPVRSLIDLVPPKDHPVFGRWLSDFKTTRNGDPHHWARQVDDKSYDVQNALHMDMYVAATGEDRTTWVWAVQENVPPYHVVRPMPAATAEFTAWGRVKYQSALRLYASCLATNTWPSYSSVGIVVGDIQLLGPEELWSYKQSVGQGSISETQDIHYSVRKLTPDDDVIP